MFQALVRTALTVSVFALISAADADLVAHWPLDTNAEDVVGGYDGFTGGGVVFGAEGAADHSGSAAEFNGSSSTITVPYSAALNPDSFTVAMWANADSTGGFASAITSRDDDGGSVNGYIIYNDSAGRWNFWTGGGGPSGSWPQLPGPPVQIGSWTHLAISYDAGSRTMRLHVNGALEQSASGAGLYSPNGSQAEDLHLGSGADNGRQFYFDGLLDDVGLWDEALTTAQIQEVMNRGIPGGAPLVVSFAAAPPFTDSGESVTLSWDTLRAGSLSIAPDVGMVAGATGSVVVSPTQTTTYTLTAVGNSPPNAVARITVGVDVEALPPVLNEFVADNETGLSDREGDREDWIEIYNPNPFAIELGGWSLTDDPAEPGKWIFPSHVLESDGYLVVFASEKNGPLDASFRLAGGGEYLALVSPDGDIVQEFAPTYPSQFDDVAFGIPTGGGVAVSLRPTPGAANGPGLSEIPPAILSVNQHPLSPSQSEALVITAEIEPRLGAIATVTLTYRVDFDREFSLHMTQVGETSYRATIPATAYSAGDMVRWFVIASTTGRETTRSPAFPDPTESAQYHGTVVADPSITSSLPVLHWFVQNTGASNTRAGTRASLYFAGRFYDNIFCRIRGQSTANWPKHKYKFDFYRGGHFFWKEGAPRVEEFNVNSHYRDGYVRENAIFAFLNEAGSPAPTTMYMWIRQNGADFGLFSFVEQIDEEFLGRHGFDASGPMYKAINVPATLSPTVNTSLYRKVLNRDDPYTDLRDFTASINISNPNRFAYVADEVNLPNYINVMAAMAVPFNHDQLTKNYYLYRDPHRQEWFRFPWDGDAGLPSGTTSSHENWASPLYGDARHTQELVNGNPNPTWQNHMHAAILDNPITREIYMRRLRNLADHYLRVDRSGNGWFENLINGWDNEISADAARDFQLWSPQGIRSLSGTVSNVLNTSLPNRRTALFRTYGPPGTGLVPYPEPSNAVVEFGVIDFNPASGDQDHEYIEITNANDYAVDLSGWRIDGGIAFTFPPGAVIPAAGADPERGKVFLSPDVISFRRRPSSPTGGESRIVLGNYAGHLSNFGETLVLIDDTGRQVARTVLTPLPSDVQLYLAVSEIMYHPVVEAAEFIELINISEVATLDLTNVRFSAGVEFDFTGGAVTSLAPGARVLVVRDLITFAAVYGTGLPVAGVFANGSALSNGGERIKIDDASGSTAINFSYLDVEPWPSAADGGGCSIVLRRPEAGTDPDVPLSWRSSALPGGNPGGSDHLAFAGGDLIAYALASGPAFENSPAGVTFSYRHRLGADNADLTVEWSSDLMVWDSEALILLDRLPDGEGGETVSWRIPSGLRGFVRLRVVAAP
jgi:hypothetical protein|tara:strand:+ start:12311 stop:16345 length:4035 start_codon:yes stop_codon:yes gene_type:complete